MAESEGIIFYEVDVVTDKLLTGNKAADASLDQLQEKFDETDSAARKFGNASTAAARQVKPLTQAVKQANNEAAAAKDSLNSLTKAIGAFVGLRAVTEVINIAESYGEMAERIQMAVKSAEEYEHVQLRLLENANATYRPLEEAQELFVRTSSSLQALSYSLDQSLDITDSFSLALVRNAASGQRAESSIAAYSKVLQTNKVSADQWESITSAIPTIVDNIAAASGRAATEVRALGATGKLAARDLNEGLRQSLEENTEAAAQMAVKVSDAWQNIKNNLAVYLGEANRANGATGVLSGALDMLGQNLDTVIKLLTTAGAGALAAYIAKTGAAAATSLNAWRASQQQYLAEVAKARALVASAAAAEAAARANARLGGSTAAVTAATKAHTAAQTALNATLISGAGAGKLMLAALGGPVGIIALVASAAAGFLLFRDNAKAAEQTTIELRDAVDQLSAAQARQEKRQNEARLEQIEKEMRETQNLINLTERMQKVSFTEHRAEKLDQHIITMENLQREMEALEGRQRALNGEPAGTDEAPEQTTTVEGQRRLAQMRDELALLEVIGVERAKLAALQKLGNDATPQERAEAEALAVKIFELENRKKDLAKTTKEETKEVDANVKAIKDLEESVRLAALAGEALAEAKAVARLNEFASPEDIERAKELARELYNLEEIQKRKGKFGDTSRDADSYIVGDADTLSGGLFDNQFARYQAEAEAERLRHQDSLDRLKEARELKIETNKSYDDLEAQIAQTHANRMAQIDQAKNQLLLSSGEQTFNALADVAGTYAGKQSTLYRTLFATSKAFAIAQSTMAITQGIAQAAANPWPENIAAMASVAAATAGLVSNISSITMGGGRFMGGPVSGGSAYRVNEGGAPEIFNAANGHQYLLPNAAGEVVSNKKASAGGASIQNIVTIQVGDAGASTAQSGPGSEDAAALGNALRMVVVDELERQSRPGGILWIQRNGR